MKKASRAMAAMLLLVSAAVLARPASGQSMMPSLTVKEGGKAKELELRSASLSIEREGRFVETVWELEFFNHTKRMQEGEFTLQLPEGATVSTYALEVNGVMRPGVAVDKVQARTAYESIKRRMVDPGLVEREVDNVYRTRIFPIEAGKPKRVRIGFIHRLSGGGGYVVPFEHEGELRTFDCSVRGVKKVPKLTLGRSSYSGDTVPDGVWEWSGKDVELDGFLQLFAEAVPTKNETRLRMERQPGGDVHFLLQGALPEVDGKNGQVESVELPEAGPEWGKVRLLWDVSLSRRWLDHEAERKALHRLWKWIGTSEVTVQTVGLQLGEPKEFPVRDGKADNLDAFLKGIVYDGAANFSEIDAMDEEGMTILVSDGRLSSPAWDLRESLPMDDFFVLHLGATGSGGSDFLRGEATRVDGGAVNFPMQLSGVFVQQGLSLRGMSSDDFQVTVVDGEFAVSGRMPAGHKGRVRVQGQGGEEMIVDPAMAQDLEVGGEWAFVRRVWAQGRLKVLEELGNPAMISEFSVRERLVSDRTSLIVLERMEDHLRYRIPPPEPELLKEYEERLRKPERRMTSSDSIGWRQKVEWHRTDFPWVDANLQDEISTVSIWVKASRQVFEGEQLNAAELKPYHDWIGAATEVAEEGKGVQSAFDFHAWMARLEEKLAELEELRNQPAPPQGDRPLHVSVRGFVEDRGIYSTEKGKPLGLRQAIERAGGPNEFGEWSRVYLYRDARRVGYNTESSIFKEVPLQWGDMVVVEKQPPAWGWGHGPVDPFMGTGEREPQAPKDQAPVFEEAAETPRRPMAGGGGLRRPYGSQGRGANDAPSLQRGDDQLPGEDVFRQSTERDAVVIEGLKAADDVAKHYRQLLGGAFAEQAASTATTVEMAGVFFEKRDPEMGGAVLSNLLEAGDNTIDATRSYAFWLAHFEQVSEARQLLQKLVVSLDKEDRATRSLVYMDISRLDATDTESLRRSAVEDIGAKHRQTRLLPVSMTDYFVRGGRPVGGVDVLEHRLISSDLRIVLTWAGGPVGVLVTEPDLLNEKFDHGAWRLQADRVFEYQMRRALPGEYRISLKRHDSRGYADALTVRVDFYTDFGRTTETVQTQTLLMTGPELIISDLESGWGEDEIKAQEE